MRDREGEGSGRPLAYFHVKPAVSEGSSPVMPPAVSDRLYLVNAAGLPEFRPVYDALSRMAFYNVNPDRLRDVQSPDASDLLARDGSNLTTILTRMQERHPEARQRVERYLSAIVPGLRRVGIQTIGSKQALEFVQRIQEDTQSTWRFPSTSVSDGTLRALGILVALFQGGENLGGEVTLVAIEEPEAALHPAAAGILFDSLREASQYTQVVVTSHSPDLLDAEEVTPDAILAVALQGGRTTIGPIDEVSRSILRDHLYSAGELMRQNHLQPDLASLAAAGSVPLFDEDPASW